MYARTWFWSLLLVLASILDLTLTWLLLSNSELAYEVNPVAAFVLAQSGWFGLALFKMLTVALVTGLGFAIGLKSQRSALLMFRTASVMVFAVVGYSLFVAGSAYDPEGYGSLENARLRKDELSRAAGAFERYSRRSGELARAVLTRNVSLVEAAGTLSKLADEGGYNPLGSLRVCCGDEASDEACIAAQLVRDVGFLVQDDPEAREETKAWLAEEFEAFDMPLPEYSSESFTPDDECLWYFVGLLQFSLSR